MVDVAPAVTAGPAGRSGTLSPLALGPLGRRERWSRDTSLLWVLSRRNFQVRYKRSRLGVLWGVLQPTVQALVLALVFTLVFKVTRGPHYVVYVLSGMVAWQLMSMGSTAATTSAVDNAALLRKVAVTRVLFPLSALGGAALVGGLQLIVVVVAALADGTLGWHVLLMPLAILLSFTLVAAVGIAGCALHPSVRDVRFLLESALLVLFYASPVLYDPSRLSGLQRHILMINPAYGMLSLWHSAVLSRGVDLPAVLLSAAESLLVLSGALVLFSRRSGDFADLV